MLDKPQQARLEHSMPIALVSFILRIG